jgi:hypothetical protein
MGMLVTTIELTQSSASKRTTYLRFILFLLAVTLIAKTGWFSRWGSEAESRSLHDFDGFYIAAQMVWRGNIEQAYHFATMLPMQQQLDPNGSGYFLPWTYPPQFDLLIAPLVFLPLGTAYCLFTTGTLVLYLVTLRQVAGDYFALVLLLLFPAFIVTIACGQNSFLTGALIGLVCLNMQKRQSLAGLPLGLMVIKPHLAVAFALYTFVARRWKAVLVAAATVVVTSALATVLLGSGVWTAFFEGVQESRIFLESGLYPTHRMISTYAALRSFGFPAWAAFAGQAVTAIVALAVVCLAIRRGFAPRQALGLTAIASMLISPYAYDYDLTVFGIGIALLLPDILRLGTERERAAIYGLSFVTAVFGLAQVARFAAQYGSSMPYAQYGSNMPYEMVRNALSVAGLTLPAILGLTWRILLRDYKSRPLSQTVCAAE